jgi:outer membrane protein
MKKIVIYTLTIALMLSSCGGKRSDNIERTTPDSTFSDIPVLKAEKGDVVFVRMDSILNAYDMYHEVRKEYEEDVMKAENDLRAKATAFQKEVNSFSEKYDKGLITRSQAADEQTKLYNRQQSLEEESNKIRNELAEKEVVLLNQIHNAIVTYINKYNEDKGYSLIISTNGTSPVLYGNPGLDITNEIIQGLNDSYIKNR